MTTTIFTRFFRAGVGTVIYNEKNEVLIFERAQYPVGIWQFQQGGIDKGESVETTLWRELKEEAGFEKTDFERNNELPFWTVYQDMNSADDDSIARLGQAHRWFFLKLKPDVKVDLTKADDDEFSDYKWITFAEAIAQTNDLKKHVYQQLETYFLERVRP